MKSNTQSLIIPFSVLITFVLFTSCTQKNQNNKESVIHYGTLINPPFGKIEKQEKEQQQTNREHYSPDLDTQIIKVIDIYEKDNKGNKLVGKWYSSEIGLTFIKQENEKYFITEMALNSNEIGKDFELIVKWKNGKYIYVIKDLFEGNNLNPGVKLVNDYTDYFVIEEDGNLYLYDSEGLIEKRRKID